MKVLLDENMPHRLRTKLIGHDVMTVKYCGWLGLTNGTLIAEAEREGFEVFLTGDKNMSYQQNILGRRIAIIILSTVDGPLIEPHIPKILAAIESALQGSFQTVACGNFRRSKS